MIEVSLPLKNKGFQEVILAFLNAVEPSRAGIPQNLKESVQKKPVENMSEFWNRFLDIKEKSGNLYDGFGFAPLKDPITEVTWTCLAAHPSLRGPDDQPTRITLKQVGAEWCITVSARSESTALARIASAKGEKTASAANRIKQARA